MVFKIIPAKSAFVSVHNYVNVQLQILLKPVLKVTEGRLVAELNFGLIQYHHRLPVTVVIVLLTGEFIRG